MKTKSLMIFAGVCFASLFFFEGALSAAPAGKTVKKKVKKVAAPRPEKVKASSFGFNEEDATECLQKAINSNAKEVVIDYTGKDYIIGKRISLRSNQTITLEKNVVLRAKKGAFQKRGMFVREGGENITIRGMGGSRIIMNKADYRNPKLYQQSEHRHIFNFASVSNVTIKDLSLEDSGGDGIYFGGYLKRKRYCENILVENVNFSGHNRLGIAVISGKNVIIRNCRFVNAEGCPPQGGIDLEPNQNVEMLKNILIENCVFENNKGAALSVAPSKLDNTSEKVSVTVRNCKFSRNGIDLYLHPYYSKNRPYPPVSGKITLENMVLSSVTQFHTPVQTVLFELKNCVFNPPVRNSEYFDFTSAMAGETPVGNIRFINCKLNHPGDINKQKIFRVRYLSESLFSDLLGGELAIVTPTGTKNFDFEALKKAEKTRFAKLYKYRPIPLDIKKLSIPEKDAARVKNENLHFRNCDFLQYAEKGQKITLLIKSKRIGYDSSISYNLTSPSGQKVENGSFVPGESKTLSFTAEETGIYRLYVKSFNVEDIISSHRGNGLTHVRGNFNLIQSSGRLYFMVPAGVKNFAIGATGKAQILVRSLAGETVLKNTRTGEMQAFECSRKNADKAEIFYIEVKNVFWSIAITLFDPLPPVISTNPETLFR